MSLNRYCTNLVKLFSYTKRATLMSSNIHRWTIGNKWRNDLDDFGTGFQGNKYFSLSHAPFGKKDLKTMFALNTFRK